MTVQVTREGPVTIVTIDRPEARNAVDGPTAAALADAFRDFDADEDAAVAVLTGAGGTFCAGADLKAVGTERGNRVERGGRRPDGPEPDAADQAGDRRDRGPRRRGRPRAGAVGRPPGRRRRRGARGLLPPLGRPADRRRHRSAAAADRSVAGDGPRAHRAPGGGRGGPRDGAGQPARPVRYGARGRPWGWRRSWRRCRRPACGTTG